MGVQLGFMGVQLGRKVIWAVLPGCDRSAGRAARQGMLSPCFLMSRPCDAATTGPLLARDSIPAHRPLRFRTHRGPTCQEAVLN